MCKRIENAVMDQERALYGAADTLVISCRFDGPADGESALKECDRVAVRDSYFNLRYPFWHDRGLEIAGCELTPQCRAALWYSSDVTITDTKLHGIKALRECHRVTMKNCEVDSAEFGWYTRGLAMEKTSARGEYFLMGCRDLRLKGLRLKGKYSFQYVEMRCWRTATWTRRTHSGTRRMWWCATARSKASIWPGTARM